MACWMKREDFDFGWDELKDKLLNPTGRAARIGNLTEEDADRIIELFKRTDKKNNSAPHLYAKIGSMAGALNNGAYKQCVACAEFNESPAYQYLVRWDAPYQHDQTLHVAWHTAELPLAVRVVAYPDQCLGMSYLYSEVYASFIKYGDPSIDRLQAKPFTTEERNCIVFDDVSHIEVDPLREIYEGLGVI